MSEELRDRIADQIRAGVNAYPIGREDMRDEYQLAADWVISGLGLSVETSSSGVARSPDGSQARLGKETRIVGRWEKS